MTKLETSGSQTPVVIPGGSVLYVGRIPHGFYEDEMRSYFSQFGDITRLRISRNKRTGASKHYGFIEFRHASVAKIAAETMHNYLLFGHLLQCKIIPNNLVHSDTFKGANRKFRPIPKKLSVLETSQPAQKTEVQLKRAEERKMKKQNKLSNRLAELGIKI
jgi:nucleolar protein 15